MAFWAEDAPPGPTLVGLVATECAGAEALGPAAFGVSVHIEAVVGGGSAAGEPIGDEVPVVVGDEM